MAQRARFEREVLPAFTGRVLPFHLDASQTYATLMARARREGKAISTANGYIAATAASRALMVTTLDVAPFQAASLKDLRAATAMRRRIERTQAGRLGDAKPVRGDVSEMRVDVLADPVTVPEHQDRSAAQGPEGSDAPP